MVAAPGRVANHEAQLSVVEQIDALIQQFYSGGNRTVVTARWQNVKRQDMRNESGRKQLVQLADWVMRKAPEMQNVPAGETREHAAGRLILLMSAHVYGIPDEEVPEVTATTDATVSIVEPADVDTVKTPAELAAAVFPEGSVSEPTIVVVSKVDSVYPRCEGPLDTERCQYPLFYKFSHFPDQKFLLPVTVAVCRTDAALADHDRFRLAHERPPAGHEVDGGTIEGNIEILPYVATGSLIDCEDLDHPEIHTHASSAFGRAAHLFARAARTAVGFFAPRPLYARIDRGSGGELEDFSHVVTVDPQGEADLEPAPSSPTAGITATPLTVVRGDPVTLSSWSIANTGSANAANVGSSIILATDSALTNAVAQVSAPAVTVVSAASSTPGGAVSLAVPQATPAGHYYLGVRIDPSNSVPESDETDNHVSVRITVTDPYTLYCPTGGFGAYATMQDAIDHTLPGGTVAVCSGTHTVTDTIRVDKAITIRSLHPDGATFQDGYAGSFSQGAALMFLVDGIAQGTVRFADINMSVRGKAILARGTYDRLVLDSVSMDGRDSATAIALQAYESTVSNNRIEVAHSDFTGLMLGIWPTGQAQVDVHHSHFANFAGGAVIYSFNGATLSQPYGTVSNNTFENCSPGGCIRILQGGGVRVAHNTFSQTAGQVMTGAVAMLTTSSNLPRSPVIVEDNVVVSQVILTAASPQYRFASGIMINDTSTTVTHVVRRNQVTDARAGIVFAASVEAHDNTIFGGQYAFQHTSNRASTVIRNDFTGQSGSFTSNSAGSNYRCNWWGSTAGPTSPPTSVSSGTWQPVATQPIANKPTVLCNHEPAS